MFLPVPSVAVAARPVYEEGVIQPSDEPGDECHFFALLSGDRDLLLSTLLGQAAAAAVIEPLDIRKGNK